MEGLVFPPAEQVAWKPLGYRRLLAVLPQEGFERTALGSLLPSSCPHIPTGRSCTLSSGRELSLIRPSEPSCSLRRSVAAWRVGAAAAVLPREVQWSLDKSCPFVVLAAATEKWNRDRHQHHSLRSCEPLGIKSTYYVERTP